MPGTRSPFSPRARALPLLVLVAAGILAGCTSGASAAEQSGSIAYVTNLANRADPGGTVAIVDTASGSSLSPVTTGTLPSALAASPDGARVLVANEGQDTVTMLDASSRGVIASVDVGLKPDAVAVTPNGRLALVANFGDNTVTPISLPSLHTGTPIPVGVQPTAIAIAPNGSVALVANFGDNTVTPISLPALHAGAPIPAGSQPEASPAIAVDGNATGIAIQARTQTAYVSGGDALTPIDLATMQAKAPLDVGAGATAVALANHGAVAWVCTDNGTLLPINVATGHKGRAVKVGGQPSAIVIPAAARS